MLLGFRKVCKLLHPCRPEETVQGLFACGCDVTRCSEAEGRTQQVLTTAELVSGSFSKQKSGQMFEIAVEEAVTHGAEPLTSTVWPLIFEYLQRWKDHAKKWEYLFVLYWSFRLSWIKIHPVRWFIGFFRSIVIRCFSWICTHLCIRLHTNATSTIYNTINRGLWNCINCNLFYLTFKYKARVRVGRWCCTTL